MVTDVLVLQDQVDPGQTFTRGGRQSQEGSAEASNIWEEGEPLRSSIASRPVKVCLNSSGSSDSCSAWMGLETVYEIRIQKYAEK